MRLAWPSLRANDDRRQGLDHSAKPQFKLGRRGGVDIEETLTKHLSGRRLVTVTRREYDWNFRFEDAGASGLTAECPWRIIVSNRIALASSDDGHQFGQAVAVNAEKVSLGLLGSRIVERVSIRPDTGDASIVFSGNVVLEVLNMSSGYEGWRIGIAGLLVIATGGGELAIFKQGP
jgi:hypothetical protein